MKEDNRAQKRKNRALNKMNKLLEVPAEVYSKEPKVTILGFKQILIENYKGILEYQDFYVRAKLYTGIINVNGFNLTLTEMTKDDIMISGDIDSIDFEKTEE